MRNVISIRPARPADHDDLLTLAVLDSAAALDGDILVAAVDGEVQAALSLSDGRAVADPFRRTAQLVALLRLQAQDLARPARASARAGLRRLTLTSS